MNQWILWLKWDSTIKEEHGWSFEVRNYRIKLISPDAFYIPLYVDMPLLHLTKMSSIRFHVIPGKCLLLLFDYQSNQNELTSNEMQVRESLYRSFTSAISNLIEFEKHLKNTPSCDDSFISPMGLFHSKLVNLWYPGWTLPDEWIEYASGSITSFENPPVYDLENIFQLPLLRLRSGFVDPFLPETQPNQKVCLIISSKYVDFYQNDVKFRQKKVHPDESGLWCYTEKEWNLTWAHHKKEHEKDLSWKQWRKFHPESNEYPFLFSWDAVYWITDNLEYLNNIGFYCPYPNTKQMEIVMVNEKHIENLIYLNRHRYVQVKTSIHHHCLFDLAPQFWKKWKIITENPGNTPISTQIKELYYKVEYDNWDKNIRKLLEDRGDLFELRRLDYGLSPYHYPNFALTYKKVLTKLEDEITCSVSYETADTCSMIQWACGHCLETETHWKWLATTSLSHRHLTCPTCRFHTNSHQFTWRYFENMNRPCLFVFHPFGSYVKHMMEWMMTKKTFGIILPSEPIGSALWRQIPKWQKCWNLSTKKRRNYRSNANGVMPLSINLPEIMPDYLRRDDLETIKVLSSNYIKNIKTQQILSSNVDRWVWISRQEHLPWKMFLRWLSESPDREIYVCANVDFEKPRIIQSII